MNRTRTLAGATASALLAMAFTLTAAGAQAASKPLLVSADWLAKNLANPAVVVIHSSQSKTDYDAGHVPGSRWLAWTTYTNSTQGGLSTQLPVADSLEAALEAMGVGDASHIVISGGPIQVSGRLLFTLEYFGMMGRVSFLDGGIDAWREAGRPVERTDPPSAATRGTLTLKVDAARLADAARVNASATTPGVSILDARAPEFYLGVSSGGQPRAGHIPGAMNIPFTWLTGDVSQFRDRGKLQRLFDQAGVKKGNKVVTYCHIGMQASALYTAARILGYDVAVYDGSWEEWSRKTELPIVGLPKP